MFFKFDIINFAILLVFVVNTVFGLIVYGRDRKNATNKSFFLFTLTVTGWCLGMVLYRGFNDVALATLFCRLLYVSAVLIPLSLIYFAINFPEPVSSVKKWQKYLLPIPTIVLIVFSLLPNHGLIESISFVSGGESIIHFNFILELVYVSYISIYFLYYFLILGNKFSYSFTDGVLHQRLFYIMVGTALSSTIGIVSNLLLVMLGIFTFNWLGQVGLIFMITLITFAVLKYHLFDARIISAELLVGFLWLFILFRIFFSVSASDQIINIAFLFVTMIAGFFLIESVKKEVELRDQLQIANEGQTNLIHIMNHQIKGYLTIHKNIFAELLTNDYGKIPKSAREIIEKGMESADKGTVYVTNILRGASAQNGVIPYDTQDIDFKGIVLEKINSLKEAIEKKGLNLEINIIDGNYQMTGDGMQLAEAVRNLIENSMNYTIYGQINIRLEKLNNKILFSVKDTGIGIRASDKDKIFKAGGVSSDSIKINVNSSGYGLVFVKGVIEKHSGKIWFESMGRNKGTVFFIELPVK